MKTKAEVLTPFILQWEGGLSNNPIDSASDFPCPTKYKGEYWHTNKGITYRTWYNVFGECMDADFLKMSHKDWTHIMKKYYWDRWKADDIQSQGVANILVDWLWGSGIPAITIPQKMIGVNSDGIVGPKTLSALNAIDKDELAMRLYARRKVFLERIIKYNPSQKAFFKGWMNRLNSLKSFNSRL